MFHKWLTISLSIAISLALQSGMQAQDEVSFQFKPAQTSLTSILRQLAESLEREGHPGSYLKHVKAENERIAAKYQDKFGRVMASYLPQYMSDEYIENLLQQWDELAPKLKLARLSRESGRLMRLAIDGENGKGTSLIVVLNHHQNLVYADMTSDGKRTVGFEQLKQKFHQVASGNEAKVLAETESKLSAAERRDLALLLSKPKFSKTDFAALERFYNGPHDRLSEYGKSLLSARVFAGQRGQGVPVSNAVKYSAALQNEFETLFGKLRDQLTPETASTLENWVTGVVIDAGRAACSELELGIQENALDRSQRN
ncbi:MAG: hypothetical protein P1V20_22590 [Verrucomicrobiales bacterium]|nr:hypothetical protein [Verrucomicrobiales bacterium]